MKRSRKRILYTFICIIFYANDFCEKKKICGIIIYCVSLESMLSDAYFCLFYEKINFCKITNNIIIIVTLFNK